MKRIIFIGMILLIGFGCEKSIQEPGYQVPTEQVPEWLKLKITDEAASDNLGAWIRYEFQGEVYFEYSNLVSSSFPDLYSEIGALNPFSDTDIWQDYMADKCCAQYIWRGKDHIEVL